MLNKMNAQGVNYKKGDLIYLILSFLAVIHWDKNDWTVVRHGLSFLIGKHAVELSSWKQKKVT